MIKMLLNLVTIILQVEFDNCLCKVQGLIKLCFFVKIYYRIMETAPTLPDFALALKPDDYQLPQVSPSWRTENVKGGQNGSPNHLKG